MKTWVTEKIARLNQEFYQKFAQSFAVTRHRIQPGVARILAELPSDGNWLDIGCGNGTLALALVKQNRRGTYFGCDLSSALIKEAKNNLNAVRVPGDLAINFKVVDINREDWVDMIPKMDWNWLSMFAVMHHIPSASKRRVLCARLRKLLSPGHSLFISVWQPKNSPRLLTRIKSWQLAGLRSEDVEEGDVLIDWRAGAAGKDAITALRYVHIFSEVELKALAESSNFRVVDSFHSDGKEGNLALYQIWN